MKTDIFLTMESLINVSGKLLKQTGEERCSTANWEIFHSKTCESGYCRTYVRTCPEGEGEAMFHDLMENIRTGELPHMVTVVAEEVPEALMDSLERGGYSACKRQTGMLMRIADYQAKAADPCVERITEDMLPEWSAVCTKGFGRAKDELPALQKLFQNPTCRFYAYRMDGKVVATLMMSLQPGNAGLHEVATLQEYRGRGCCRALLNRAFLDARELGYPIMSLQASALGAPVYASIGMKEICRIATYRF